MAWVTGTDRAGVGVEPVLFDAIPAVLNEIEHEAGVRLVQPVLSYGSWTGGDMDGHPEVGFGHAGERGSRCTAPSALRLLRARVDKLAQSFSPLVAARAGVPGARGLARPGRGGAAERGSWVRRPHREWSRCAPSSGFVHHPAGGNTLHPAWP